MNDDDDFDYTCPECSGSGEVMNCCDDLCIGSGNCIHGDMDMCPTCGGEGEVGP